MTKLNFFLRSLPATASALGAQLGVKVVVGGEAAFTNGKTIHVPAVGADINEQDVLALILHEAGHVRFTDFSDGFKGGFEGCLFNIVEDVRIERLMSEIYGGAYFLLDSTHGKFQEKWNTEIQNGDYTPRRLLSSYILLYGNAKCHSAAWSKKALTIYRKELVDNTSDAIVKALDQILDDFEFLRTTEQAKELVQKILKFIRSFQNSSCQESKTDDQGTKDEQQGEADSQNDSSTDKSNNQEVKSDNPASKSTSDDHQGNDGLDTKDSMAADSTANSNQSAASADESTNQSFFNNIKPDETSTLGHFEELKENLHKSASSLEGDPAMQIVISDDGKCTSHPTQEGKLPAVPIRVSMDTLHKAKSNSAGIGRKLRSALEGLLRNKSYTSHRGTRLASSALSSIAVWNTRVFEKREEHKKVNTAFNILLDTSDSMDGKRLNTAIDASLALIAALTPIRNVKIAFNAFFHGQCRTLVDFNERVQPYLRKGVLNASCCGCTPTHIALIHAKRQFDRLPVTNGIQKKIICVITDGFPDDQTMMLEAADSLRNQGFIVCAIGIGYPEWANTMEEIFKKTYDKYVLVYDSNELKQALFALCHQLMK